MKIILYSFNTQIVLSGRKYIPKRLTRHADNVVDHEYHLVLNDQGFNGKRILPILHPTKIRANIEITLLIPSKFKNEFNDLFFDEFNQKISWNSHNTNILSDAIAEDLKSFILEHIQHNEEYKKEISSMAFSKLFPEICCSEITDKNASPLTNDKQDEQKSQSSQSYGGMMDKKDKKAPDDEPDDEQPILTRAPNNQSDGDYKGLITVVLVVCIFFALFLWFFMFDNKYEQAKRYVLQGNCEKAREIVKGKESLERRVEIACQGMKKKAEPGSTHVDHSSLTVILTKETWMRIKNKTNDRLFEGIAGESDSKRSVEVTGEPPFELWMGHLEGVSIEYMGITELLTNHPNSRLQESEKSKFIISPTQKNK
jgi:hypothetical protein